MNEIICPSCKKTFKVDEAGLNLVSKDVTVFNANNANQILLPTVFDNTNNVSANLHIASNGVIYRATATTYTAEEVDQKLAIKDKLIEKLSARLDALEKRVK